VLTLILLGGSQSGRAEEGPWQVPADRDGLIYELGSGPTAQAALDDVKTRLAGKLGLTLPRALQKEGPGADTSGVRPEKLGGALTLWQHQVIHDFEVVRGPEEVETGAFRVTGRCARKGAFDAHLEALAFDLFLHLGKEDRVIVCPPLTPVGRQTGLGSRVGAILSSALARYSHSTYQVYDCLTEAPQSGLTRTVRGTVRVDGAARSVRVDLALHQLPEMGKLWGRSAQMVVTADLLELSGQDAPRCPLDAGFHLVGAVPRKGAIKVEVELNRKTFGKQAPVIIRVRADADGFAYVFNVLDDGSVALVAPNSYRTQVTVEKDRWVVLPGEVEESQGVSYVAFPLKGRKASDERIKAIVTERPIEELGKIPMAGFETLGGTDARLPELLELLRRLDQEGVRWGEARTSYRVTE